MMLTSDFFVCCVVIFMLLYRPSMSIELPTFNVFELFGKANRESRQTPLKKYSGERVKNDSILMVYFHDQTVAVAELGPKKLLLNCELIEVYEPEQAVSVLGELQKISRPVSISLNEMLMLMDKCQQLERFNMHPIHSSTNDSGKPEPPRNVIFNNPFSLFSGIIPGTKWCGTGDIAQNYHDLGSEPNVDMCCRAHDLCPVKVRAYSRRYNLTNGSLYTKSHCKCDDNLFDCLKSTSSQTAKIMGNVYFNLVQVPCLDDGKDGKRKFRTAKNNF